MTNKSTQFSLARLFVFVAGAAGMVAQLIACICEPYYISAAYDVPILLASIAMATWLTRLPEHPQHRYSSRNPATRTAVNVKMPEAGS